MLVMLSDPVPVFVRVTVCAALLVPTVVPPAPALNVAITEVIASLAEEVAVAVCVPVAETILPSENASVPADVLGEGLAYPYPAPAVQVPDPLFLAK